MLAPINIPSLNGRLQAGSRLQNLSNNLGSNEVQSVAITEINSKTENISPSASPEENINQTIAREKENLLLYQLMRAIAQQKHNKQEQSASYVTDLELSASFSQQINIGISSESSSLDNSGVSTSTFLNLEFVETSQANFNVSINQETGGLSVSFSFTQSRSLSVSATTESQTKQVDPLIVNLSDEDFQFDLSNEVSFDLDANGSLNNFYSPANNNYFLALDKNQNGIIDNGLELFGDAGKYQDGFQALRQYDLNADGMINVNDQVYKQLLLLSFDKFGGQELKSINNSNITEINLNARYMSKSYQDNNQLIAASNVNSESGQVGQVGDFLITVR